MIYFSENINDLLDTLANYSKHVKSVYGLESFYGDQVLHKLLKHSQEIVEQIETFDEILYLTEEEGELMNEQEEQFDQYDTDSTDSREDTKRSAAESEEDPGLLLDNTLHKYTKTPYLGMLPPKISEKEQNSIDYI